MIVYRLTISAYQKDLTGNGSKIYGGRWNTPGLAAIYTAENISLSVLEILVAADKNTIPPEYFLIKLYIPDDLPLKQIHSAKLKTKWDNDPGYTQFIGSTFLRSGKEAIMKMPSAIVKDEHNFLLNPSHTGFKKIKILNSEPFDIDIRLFKSDE